MVIFIIKIWKKNNIFLHRIRPHRLANIRYISPILHFLVLQHAWFWFQTLNILQTIEMNLLLTSVEVWMVKIGDFWLKYIYDILIKHIYVFTANCIIMSIRLISDECKSFWLLLYFAGNSSEGRKTIYGAHEVLCRA